MNSSPTRRGKLTSEQICDFIDQAIEATNVSTIIFAGGEPLLLREDLFTSLQHVKRRGLKSRLVTNSYWANSEQRALSITQKLFDHGLNELNLSIDDFHLPFISPLNVRRAFDAARQFDFDSIIIVHCTGPQTKFNDRELDDLLGVKLPRMYDDERELVPLDARLGRPYLAVSNTTVQNIGRANIALRPEEIPFTQNWETQVTNLGGCPYAVRSPAISPEGHLLSCCGFEVAGNEVLDIGDLKRETMEDLLNRADNDLPLNMIALEGPYRIRDLLKKHKPDLPFKKRYSSYCELCQDIVTKPELRQGLYSIMPLRVPHIVAMRKDLEDRARQEAKIDALYHAADLATEPLEANNELLT